MCMEPLHGPRSLLMRSWLIYRSLEMSIRDHRGSIASDGRAGFRPASRRRRRHRRRTWCIYCYTLTRSTRLLQIAIHQYGCTRHVTRRTGGRLECATRHLRDDVISIWATASRTFCNENVVWNRCSALSESFLFKTIELVASLLLFFVRTEHRF